MGVANRQSRKRMQYQYVCAEPPKADIGTRLRHVGFVPKADIMRRSKEGRYSIALSARARIGALVSRKDYSARLRANAPTRPTNVAKDLLASNSSSRREASVVGSPNVSSGRRNASARGHTARSMS